MRASLGSIVFALAASHGLAIGQDVAEPRVVRPDRVAELVERAPESAPPVVWRDDLDAAFAEAERTRMPLFVTFRCLPCKQCASFDRDVLEGGPELDPLLRRFVTVRITDAAGLDLRTFPVEGFQDLDLSWWGWLLAPSRDLYGVFGGRDHVADDTRISVAALANTLRRVLAHHVAHDAAAIVAREPTVRFAHPEDLPGYPSWRARTTEHDRRCLHCHQVGDVLRQSRVDVGLFDPDRDLRPWPVPEAVGLELDRDDGLRVTSVHAESPAAAAGIEAGDILAVAGGIPLFGQADLRGVLHRAPSGAGEITVSYWRRDELRRTTIATAGDWKASDLGWRMTVSQGNVGSYPTFWPLAAGKRERAALGLGDEAMAVRPWFGPKPSGPAFAAGLRNRHVITAVDGKARNAVGRGFLVWFRNTHGFGDPVELTVRDGEKTRTIVYDLPLPSALRAAPFAMRMWSRRDLPGPHPRPGTERVDDRSKNPDVPNRAVVNVTEPLVTAWLPERAEDEARSAAVVICPGGGYRHLAIDKAGHEIARWFRARGVAAFVLKYRLPRQGSAETRELPRLDVQRAIRLVRARADAFGVDPGRVGVIGFSAGGHVASTAATHLDSAAADADADDPVERVSARPDFAVLVYPVVSMREPAVHASSRRRLLGKQPDDATLDRFSNERRVSAATPPTFLVHCEDDFVSVENSRAFHAALIAAGVAASELVTWPTGGHGFGLRGRGPAASWPDRMLAWLREHAFVP